ncbi:MAG: TIGR04086 family membrane protein [Lachnospiraceae bacterium]|nr:TIGR04086 family membrane protein [Lachnospiraceae bacterium]
MGKRPVVHGTKGVIGAALVSIAAAAVTAAALILLAAFLMDRFSLGEDTLKKAVYAIHFAAAFVCGFVMGKQKKEKKFLWGLAAGGAWLALLLICSLILHNGSLKADALLAVVAACAGGSMLGGMLS